MDDHDQLDLVMAEANMEVDGVERSLSVEQTEKVIQFHEITGLSDLHACRQLLERQNWRLEDAVQEHLGIGDAFSQPDDIGFIYGPRLRNPRGARAGGSNSSSSLSSGGPPLPPRPLRPLHPDHHQGDGNGAGFAPLRYA